MPRFRTSYTLTPPKPRFPAGFLEVRDRFRAADFDLYCESTIRFVGRAGDERFGPWRSVAEARAWLEAQTSARRAR